MKLDDGRLTFVAQQEVTALDAIHKAVLGKAACAGRVTEGVGTCISIHAPTWGATRRRTLSTVYIKFQSTHPRGVRQRQNAQLIAALNFNPRTHVGCDVLSISASASSPYFNPRTLVGCDSSARTSSRRGRYFNPRTHVGCDTEAWRWRSFRRDFNPRTHVGCDSKMPYSDGRTGRFQSTHPRGVRRGDGERSRPVVNISIHAPTWGATRLRRRTTSPS